MRPRPCAALIALVALAAACSATNFTVIKTREELEAKLAPKFPVMREKFLVSVTLSDPKVLLRPEDTRVGLDLATVVKAPLGSPLAGRVAVLGVPHYDPERKSFYLHEPRIERIDFPGFDLQRHEKSRAALEAAVGVALQSIPVYTLEGRTWKEASARHLLKDVRVTDGKVQFTLGL